MDSNRRYCNQDNILSVERVGRNKFKIQEYNGEFLHVTILVDPKVPYRKRAIK